MSFRRLRVVTAMVTLVFVLASCSDAPAAQSTADGSSKEHVAADVAFARNMIPHHQQAVVLAAMVPAHSANAALRMMATHIGADQLAEIRTLNGLLADWGEAVHPGGASPSDHQAMSMVGMVDHATMLRLQNLDDDAFDALWVTSMIGHHQGAIAMAHDEIAQGRSAAAVHVAELIITAQQREIAMLNHLISVSQ